MPSASAFLDEPASPQSASAFLDAPSLPSASSFLDEPESVGAGVRASSLTPSSTPITDMATLGGVPRPIAQAGQAAIAGGKGFVKGATEMLAGGVRLAETTTGTALGTKYAISNAADKVVGGLNNAIDTALPTDNTTLNRFTGTVGGVAPLVTGTIASGGSALLAGTMGGAQSLGSSAQDIDARRARGEQITPMQAATAMTGKAIVEAGTEAIGGKVFSALGKFGTGVRVAGQGVQNAAEEYGAQIGQNAIDINVLGDKKNYTEGATEAGVFGGLIGAGMGAGGVVVGDAGPSASKFLDEPPSASDFLDAADSPSQQQSVQQQTVPAQQPTPQPVQSPAPVQQSIREETVRPQWQAQPVQQPPTESANEQGARPTAQERNVANGDSAAGTDVAGRGGVAQPQDVRPVADSVSPVVGDQGASAGNIAGDVGEVGAAGGGAAAGEVKPASEFQTPKPEFIEAIRQRLPNKNYSASGVERLTPDERSKGYNGRVRFSFNGNNYVGYRRAGRSSAGIRGSQPEHFDIYDAADDVRGTPMIRVLASDVVAPATVQSFPSPGTVGQGEATTTTPQVSPADAPRNTPSSGVVSQGSPQTSAAPTASAVGPASAQSTGEIGVASPQSTPRGATGKHPWEMTRQEFSVKLNPANRANQPEVSAPTPHSAGKLTVQTLSGPKQVTGRRYWLPNYNGPELFVSSKAPPKGLPERLYSVYVYETGDIVTTSTGAGSLEDTLKLAVQRLRVGGDIATSLHRRAIERAVREGKPVPASVLADYPDLAQPSSPADTPAVASPQRAGSELPTESGAIYTINTKAGQRFAVREYLDNPRGGGDTLHQTREAAEQYAKNLASRQQDKLQREADQKAAEEKESRRKQSEAEIDGFADDKPPAAKQRIINHLNKLMRFNGEVGTLKSHIRDLVQKKGYVVKTVDGERRLYSPDDSFFEQKTVSKIGMDYAEHLQSRPAPPAPTGENKTPPTPLSQVDDQFVIPGTEEGARQEMSRERMIYAYRKSVGGTTEEARAGLAEMEKAAAEAAAQSNMTMEDVVSATLSPTDGMGDQKLAEQIAGRAVAMFGKRVPKRSWQDSRDRARFDVRSRAAREEVAGLLEESAKQKDEAQRRAQDEAEDTQTTVPVATSNLPQLEETYDAARRRWYKAKDEFDRAGYGTKRKDQLKRRADKLKDEMDAAESVYREARQADNAAKEKAAVAKNPVIAAAVAYKNADTKNIDAATYRKLKADAEKQVRDLAEANIEAAAKSIPDGADRMTDLQEKEARDNAIKEYVSAATDSPMMMEKPIIEKLAGMIRGNRLQIYRAQAAERIKGHKERQGIISSSGGRSVYDVYDFEGIDALVEKAKKEADEKIALEKQTEKIEAAEKKKADAERKKRFESFVAATPTAVTRHVAISSAAGRFAEVPGKPITIKGFESSDLFLSPSFVTDGYVVNEGTTGLAIGSGDTPQKAINAAKKMLEQQGAEKFAAAIARKDKAPPAKPLPRPTDRGGFIAIPGSGKPAQQPGKNFNLTMETTWDTIRRKVQDEFLPVQRMQEDIARQGGVIGEQSEPYLATELFQGRAADQLRALETEYVQPVVQRMRRAGLTVADIDKYLTALHAPERNAHVAKINPKLPDGGSGMTNAEAAKVVAAVAASGKKADYDYVANSVHTMNEQTRKLQLDAGLITQEQHDAWGNYQKYVPLRTDMENDGMRTGQGFNIRGQESKRATGRTSEADSPLTFSLMQAQEKIIRAEKNRVGQAMLKLVEDNPDPDLWAINDRPTMQSVNAGTGLVQTTPDPMFQYADNVLAVKRDGKVHLIEFKGEQGKKIAAAMKRLNAAKFNVIVRGVQKVLTGYKALQTSYNPDFILPNLVRDLQTAGINIGADKSAKMAAATVKGVPKAWKAAFDVTGNKAAGTNKKYHDAMREYLANGGKVDSYATEGFDETSKEIEKQLREADPNGIDRARILVRGIGNAVDRVNGATETAVRLSAYVQMREAGASPARAASFAKNLTVNFNRKGEWGSVINTLYVFSNASIQGSTRLLKSLTTTKRGAAVAGGIVASGIAYGMTVAAMFGEDEDGRKIWDRIPKHVKDTHLVLPRGGGKFFTIPLPYGYNVLFNAGRSAGEVLAGSETPGSAAFNTVKSAANAFNPLGGEGSALQMLSPTILDPFVQAAENKSWTGQPIVPEQAPFGLQKPDSQLSTRRTSATAKAVAQWLNRATGGDEVTPGKVDISPAMLDHFFEFVVGGTGRTIERAAQLPGKDEIKARDIPVVRRFVGDVPENPNLTEFYRTAKTIEDAYARTKHYLKSGDKDRARSYYKANKVELDMRKYIDEVRDKLKELREIEDRATKQKRPEVVKKARDRMEIEARKFMTVFRRKGGSVPADPG